MGAPYMTFTSNGSSIAASDAKGQQVATIERQGAGKSFQLQRIGSTIVSASHSKISGTTSMTVHGQEVTCKQSWEGMRSGKDISSPMGKFEWRTGGSMLHATEDLIEKATGVEVASCRIPSFGKGDGRLEVWVQMDDFVVDLAVASWLVMLDK